MKKMDEIVVLETQGNQELVLCTEGVQFTLTEGEVMFKGHFSDAEGDPIRFEGTSDTCHLLTEGAFYIFFTSHSFIQFSEYLNWCMERCGELEKIHATKE